MSDLIEQMNKFFAEVGSFLNVPTQPTFYTSSLKGLVLVIKLLARIVDTQTAIIQELQKARIEDEPKN